MELPGALDVTDVPRAMALDALRDMGYDIETVEYRDAMIGMQAMLDGQLDVGVFGVPQVLAAIQRGAAVTSILGSGRATRVLVTAPEIKTCSGLNNKSVSVPNIISTQTLALRRYIERQCPDATIERVVIAGAGNRLAALLAHRTAGALLELTNVLDLQAKGITQFNVLSDFGEELSGLDSATIVARRAFLDSYPETARDIVRTWILATRQVQDPLVLTGEIQQYLGLDLDHARAAARAFLDRNVWDVNGGLSHDMMRTHIALAEASEVIAPGLTPAMVADLSYLDAVLDASGRQ